MDVLSVTGYQRRTPHVVAEHKGFFAKENLEVRFHHTTYAPDHNRGMAEGRWDFTLSSADTMIARTTTDGVDYMLFMQSEEGLSAYLIGQPGVDAIEKLRGKMLAGDPGDSNLDLIRKKILRTHGMDDNEYAIEIIGSSPVRLEAFLQGRVAAAMLTPPASDKALAAGGVLLADSEKYVPGWPLNCGWTLRPWLVEHRELIVRFIRAWAAATDWLLAGQPRGDHRADDGKRKTQTRRLRKRLPESRAQAQINPPALRTVIELRKEMGVYRPPFDPPERFYDPSYWSEATGLRRNELKNASDQRAQQHIDDAQHDGAEKRRKKTGNVKSRHHGGGKLQHERVDDQPENSQREQGKRQGNNFQHEAKRRVDKADDNRRDQRRAETAHFDALKQKRDDQEARGAEKPMNEQVEHPSN